MHYLILTLLIVTGNVESLYMVTEHKTKDNLKSPMVK